MNLKEYEKKLRDLTPEELQKFNADFGGERTEIDQRVPLCICMKSTIKNFQMKYIRH